MAGAEMLLVSVLSSCKRMIIIMMKRQRERERRRERERGGGQGERKKETETDWKNYKKKVNKLVLP